MKIARFIRELPLVSDTVVQYLFKVTPPMEWDERVLYRNGKLVREHRRQRMRTTMRMWKIDRKTGREREPGEVFTSKPDPIYAYAYRHHTTSFVIASASDLKTMMARSNENMRAIAKMRGDKSMAELFAVERETEFEVETYLFPANKDGSWKSSSEMPGSQRGTLDHKVPFTDQGYVCVGVPRRPLLMDVEVEIEPEGRFIPSPRAALDAKMRDLPAESAYSQKGVIKAGPSLTEMTEEINRIEEEGGA